MLELRKFETWNFEATCLFSMKGRPPPLSNQWINGSLFNHGNYYCNRWRKWGVCSKLLLCVLRPNRTGRLCALNPLSALRVMDRLFCVRYFMPLCGSFVIAPCGYTGFVLTPGCCSCTEPTYRRAHVQAGKNDQSEATNFFPLRESTSPLLWFLSWGFADAAGPSA